MIDSQKIELVRNRIQSESIEHLKDPSYLEFKLLPELGLNDRHMNQYPKELHSYCGIGIDSWQYPNQFSKYLTYLSDCNIKNYVEIGCHKGGTFIITVEYLSRFNKIEKCLAVDNWPRNIMKEYSKINPCVEYLTIDSKSSEFEKKYSDRKWDLVLIDGDHSYVGVKADYQRVYANANYIAFHDIKNIFCPGTQQIWQDVKSIEKNVKFYEWTDQYDDVLLRVRGSVMGIGLMVMS